MAMIITVAVRFIFCLLCRPSLGAGRFVGNHLVHGRDPVGRVSTVIGEPFHQNPIAMIVDDESDHDQYSREYYAIASCS